MKAVLMTSSILIVLIAALRPVLRGKIPPKAQYALWLVVALRLLVPGNLFTSAYSALALLDRADEPPQVVQAIGQASIPVQVMSYEDAYERAIRENDSISSRYDNIEEWRATSLSPEEEELLSARAQELMRGPTVGELAAKLAKPVWLTGAALMAGWFLLVNAALRRKLRGAKRLEGVRCPLPVYVSDALPSPCLCGALLPKIYVTPAAIASPDRLRHVLAHELTHYRHRDHWWAVLRCLCLCVYWFDPLVWWAAALSRQDCELACDEGAIRALGEAERIPYGRTLVAMIAAGRNPLLQTATTMTGGKRRVRERVKLIARRPKTVVAVAAALVLIIACAVGCTFTGAPEDSPEPDSSPSLEPDSPRPTLDTLQERLGDIPEELRDKVDTSTDNSEPEALATYWLNDPKWKDLWSGYLLTLYRLDEARIRERLDNQLWPAVDIFARSGDEYYALIWPDDGRYQDDDALGEEYWSAVNTVKDYVKETVLQTDGAEPFDPYTDPPHFFSTGDRPSPEQQAIQAMMDKIVAADVIPLTLAPGGGISRVYAYEIPSLEEWDKTQGYWAYRLNAFPGYFQWEKLDAPPDGIGRSTCLTIQPDGEIDCLWVWEDFNLVAIRTPDGQTTYYEAVSADGDEQLGVFWLWPGPFQSLRFWFDEVELSFLRTTSVPDRGQSHEDVVLEWIEGFEGAMTKCAPGSMYACTYVQPANIRTDVHSSLSREDLDGFAQYRGQNADDYGKTWFTFSYELVFVPENENARDYMQAGNTADYAGDGAPDGAPEGAQFFTRVAYMELVDGNWVCEGTGTGW